MKRNLPQAQPQSKQAARPLKTTIRRTKPGSTPKRRTGKRGASSEPKAKAKLAALTLGELLNAATLARVQRGCAKLARSPQEAIGAGLQSFLGFVEAYPDLARCVLAQSALAPEMLSQRHRLSPAAVAVFQAVYLLAQTLDEERKLWGLIGMADLFRRHPVFRFDCGTHEIVRGPQ